MSASISNLGMDKLVAGNVVEIRRSRLRLYLDVVGGIATVKYATWIEEDTDG